MDVREVNKMAKKKFKRREAGDGSMRINAAGNFEYRITYIDEYGQKKRKSFTSRDEDDCYIRADEFMEKQRKRNAGYEIDATIPDIVKVHLESDFKKNFVGEQGYSRNLATLSIIERGIIGQIPIADIQKWQIDAFLQSITKYSYSVISKLYLQICLAFKEAHERKIIQRNLMEDRDLRCPRSDKMSKKVRGYTEEEQAWLVEALYEHKVPYGRNNYKLQLFIELFSGMRMGEINALKPSDIDLEKGIIHVGATVSKGLNDRIFIKEGTKTYAGMREVPISQLLEPVLKEALKKYKKNKLGLLFYDHNKDAIVTTSQVNCFFRRLCESINLEFNGQHALRHTFATRCIESEIPAIVLKKWLGHRNIHITLDTYADVFDRLNHDAMDKLTDHMSEYKDKLNGIQKAI